MTAQIVRRFVAIRETEMFIALLMTIRNRIYSEAEQLTPYPNAVFLRGI
jgi:hypothetical protein